MYDPPWQVRGKLEACDFADTSGCLDHRSVSHGQLTNHTPHTLLSTAGKDIVVYLSEGRQKLLVVPACALAPETA